MKKIFTFFTLCVVSTMMLFAANGPYGIRINGSTFIEAEALTEKDYQGRDQYLAHVDLKANDKIEVYDQGNNAGWWITIESGTGSSKANFTESTASATCKVAGCYDFYIKLMWEDNSMWVQAGSGCSNQGGGNGDNGDNGDNGNNGDDDTPKPYKPKDYASAVPSQCPDVMLQGFYWDSNTDQGYGDNKWATMLAQAGEIGAYFDLVWLPPSAKSSGGVGYLPSQYSNQNSAWGTRAELEKLIATLHAGGAKVIADIVVNHVNNKSSWCDFYDLDFGAYGKFSPDASWICKTDEMNTDTKAGACKGKATGANDDGYGSEANYAAARDWDHNSAEVRNMCKAYLKWMKNEMLYDGWRYDYCKGFHNSHINDYNSASKAYFSVMEWWDGNPQTLQDRLSDAGWNTLTFDFATKYEAFNRGIAADNYMGCKGCGLLGAGKSKYAVTFVDSHDSFNRDDNEFCGKGNSMKYKDKLLRANAFMLSMPGVPCVFYPHWADKTMGPQIRKMITARHITGVHSESQVKDEMVDNGGYQATIVGKNGYIVLQLGNKATGTIDGFTKYVSGSGYAVWVKTNGDVAPKLMINPGTTTFKDATAGLTINMEAVGGTSTATIYYTLDGTTPTTASTKYTAPFTIKETTTLKAFAVSGSKSTAIQTVVYTYKAPQTTPITVSFNKPASWTVCNLYAWNKGEKAATEYCGKWPGSALTPDADGWCHYTFDAEVKSVNFIFNAGSGKDQTSDLFTDEDVCYGWSGGAEILLEDCMARGIENVKEEVVTLNLNEPIYNVLGQRVDASYRGIIIQNGHKFMIQ